MRSFNHIPLPIVFLSMLSLSFLSLTTHIAAQTYRYHVCANTTFPDNGSHLSSLRSLLFSLSSYATGSFKFYSLSSPALNISSNNASSKLQITSHNISFSIPIHTIFLCRGDVSTELCGKCVGNATHKLVNNCSRERAAVVWYDECMVRYSNESIFSTVAVKPRIHIWNTQNITEQDQFNRLLNITMTQLASQVSNFPTGTSKFGTKEVSFSQFQNLYNLVQCTPYLSSADCNSRLQAAINRLPICCDGKQGGRVMFPSCNVRYELYQFYNETMAPALTPGIVPSPPPLGSVTGPKGKSKILTVTIVAIVTPIAASVVPFLLG
ncbi:cysteine-rich receptor-like protein kinase 25 [Corylus avellana]|uniref:cysteine-rich receptor-like protein kinase 25 n=1 Tax=Corylus avellana TaxID=13451 RepID=UPI001E22C6DD|nr:cysteine-rich receptor-like protein kinase 25 [Corylus avellana]